MLRILHYFGRTMPVIFVYIKPKAASRIRDQLHMVDKEGPYFDPLGTGKYFILL